MWGFLTCLNDILVPHLKSIFDLSYARAMLIQFAFFSAYFLFSVPWSKIVNTIGYKTTMVLGLLTMAVGAFLFIPAASVVSYPALSDSTSYHPCGDNWFAGVGEPLCGYAGQARNSIEPAGSDPGFQLARYDNRSEARGIFDPERSAVGDRTATQSHSRGIARVRHTTGGLGQDAVYRDWHCPAVTGGVDRHFEVTKNRNRNISRWKQGK